MGLELPRLYFDVSSIDEIDFPSLPEKIVIKPHNGWDSDAVMLIDGETELLSGTNVPRSSLPEYCRRNIASARFAKHDVRLLVEEFLQDYELEFAIPRDFKVYVAGGQAWVVQVIDRNAEKDKRSHSFYSRDWTKIEDLFNTHYIPGPPIAEPALLSDLMNAADFIARDIPIFFRLDFYLTTRGVVFGEFTGCPFGGYHYTPFAESYLCDLMDRFPDDISNHWTLER